MAFYDDWKNNRDFEAKEKQKFIDENTLPIGTKVKLNEDIHSEYYLDMPVGDPVQKEGANGVIVDNDDYQFYGIKFNDGTIYHLYYFDDVREFRVISKPKVDNERKQASKQLSFFD